MSHTIHIRPDPDGGEWQASFDGKRWVRGRSVTNALGALVQLHGPDHGIAFEFEKCRTFIDGPDRGICARCGWPAGSHR